MLPVKLLTQTVVCSLVKTILIISGGIEAVPGIQRAKAMGLHVVVSDGAENAPGFKYADDFIVASTYDVPGTIQAAQAFSKNQRKLDGVLSIASDVALTVASVADALGLPGIPVESAKLISNKIDMKDHLSRKGIALPWYSEINSAQELKQITKQRGFPVVVKPADSRGARGVLLLKNGEKLDWAFENSKKFSMAGQVMVEEYVGGPQISTEALILNGVGYPIGFSDRNYEYLDKYAPFIIENGGSYPSKLAPQDQENIGSLAIEAGLAMGVTNGVVKGDMVLTPDGPKVIEIALRLSGGYFSTDQIPLGTGVDLIEAAIKNALGLKINESDLKPKFCRGVAIRYFFPPVGVIDSIVGVTEARSKDWVHRVEVFMQPHEEIANVTDHTKRAGFVITTGATRDEAVERAENIVRSIKFKLL